MSFLFFICIIFFSISRFLAASSYSSFIEFLFCFLTSQWVFMQFHTWFILFYRFSVYLQLYFSLQWIFSNCRHNDDQIEIVDTSIYFIIFIFIRHVYPFVGTDDTTLSVYLITHMCFILPYQVFQFPSTYLSLNYGPMFEVINRNKLRLVEVKQKNQKSAFKKN